MGFTTNASGSSIANIGANQEIEVEENQTYYAQTTAPQKNLIAKWNANGADLSFNDDRNCIIEATYNGERQDQSCTILFTPTITRIGGSSIGFNTNANAKENQTNYNPITKTLTLTPQENNQIWYAISNKVATAIFDANGNKINTQTGIIEKNCNVFNTQTTCEITTPTITSNNITPIIIGFTTTSSGALTGVIGSNSTVNLKG